MQIGTLLRPTLFAMDMPVDPARALSFVLLNSAFGLIPGTDFLCILGNALDRGRPAALQAAAGMAAGGLVHLVLATLGLGAVIVSSPSLFSAIRFAGASYLVYVGATLAFRPVSIAPTRRLWQRPLSQGFISNVLNPKVALCFIAVIPQFVDDARGSATLQLAILGVLSVLSGWLVNVCIAHAAASLQRMLGAQPERVLRCQRLLGAALVAVVLGAGLSE